MIFVDTWAWIGLANRRDQYHAVVQTEHARLVKSRRQYVTTDFVLSELISHLFDVSPAADAKSFVETIFASSGAGVYQLDHISPDQFKRAWQMRVKYHDKPDISFVDFTSMIVMQDLGITQVFTGDQHFLQVGLGFQLLP